MKRVMVVIALLWACGGDGGIGPKPVPTVAGVWDLQTINGQALPAPRDGGTTPRIKQGTLIFDTDPLEFSDLVNYQDINVTDDFCCTPYSQTGTAVEMNDPQPATVMGDILTRRPYSGSTVWVYSRR